MKLVIKIAAGVFLGTAAILIIRAIPGWVESAGTEKMETQIKINNLNAQAAQQSADVAEKERELETHIWNLETPAQRRRGKAFAKRLANMTPDQLIAACGKPDKITSKKEAEDTLRTLEYDGYIEMSFRYPNDSGVAPYLGSTGDITNHEIGSWAWGLEITSQLPCVKKIVQGGH